MNKTALEILREFDNLGVFNFEGGLTVKTRFDKWGLNDEKTKI